MVALTDLAFPGFFPVGRSSSANGFSARATIRRSVAFGGFFSSFRRSSSSRFSAMSCASS